MVEHINGTGVGFSPRIASFLRRFKPCFGSHPIWRDRIEPRGCFGGEKVPSRRPVPTTVNFHASFSE